jgi:hypothetical protein
VKADERHAHELSEAEWREIQGKIARGERIVGAPPARPELPDARTMTDADFSTALDNINMRRSRQ